MIIAHIGFFLACGIGIGFFGAMLIATVLDWRQARQASKNRVWAELQRTDYEHRRPAAK
jgi:H+/Cl- antiporter ClcA